LWNIVLLDGWSCGTLFYSTDDIVEHCFTRRMILWNIVLLDGWYCGTSFYPTDGLVEHCFTRRMVLLL